MKSRMSRMIVVLGLLLAGSGAEADRPFGPYLSMHGGSVMLRDARNEVELLGLPDISVDTDYDTGFEVGGALGYASPVVLAGGRFGPTYPRFEVEIAYRENDFDSSDIGDLRGEASSLSGMFNVWLDVDTRTPVVPFIGFGLGVAGVKWDEVEAPSLFPGMGVDDRDTVFAYQFGAGLAFSVTPWLVLFADYRYFATVDPDFELSPSNVTFESEYDSHNFGGGLRYYFY